MKHAGAQENLTSFEIESSDRGRVPLVITLGQTVEISYQENPPAPLPRHELRTRLIDYYHHFFNTHFMPSLLKIGCVFFVSVGGIFLKTPRAGYFSSNAFHYSGIESIVVGAGMGLGAVFLRWRNPTQ